MSFFKVPGKSEDHERAKLAGLAAELQWTHKAGDPETIQGDYSGYPLQIGVDQKLFEVDVLFYKTQSPSLLTGMIVHEDWETRAGKTLAKILQKLNANYYADIESGDEFIDSNYHFHVTAKNKNYMEAFATDRSAQEILKETLAYFEQITFDTTGVTFYKLIEKGDLDLNKVRETCDKVCRFDTIDGLYA